jgi:hypothetical protein
MTKTLLIVAVALLAFIATMLVRQERRQAQIESNSAVNLSPGDTTPQYHPFTPQDLPKYRNKTK